LLLLLLGRWDRVLDVSVDERPSAIAVVFHPACRSMQL
jgi:hypothetical protein